MFKTLLFGVLLAATTAGAPNDSKMAPLQYVVGTWHCTWQAGGSSGSLDQVFAPALGGAWLEEKELVNAGGGQTLTSLHYTGYDPRAKEYVHVGPDADGSYEIAHSADAEVWTNADGRFIHHRVSADERTMSETASVGGKMVQSSMRCTRAKS